jgi:hypothetical protein
LDSKEKLNVFYQFFSFSLTFIFACPKTNPTGQHDHLGRSSGLPGVFTPLRGAARKERATSESR